jgi:hypothetical protein
MNDEDLLEGLRDAARRSDGQPTETPLDAPLGIAFEEAIVARLDAVVRPPQSARPRVLLYLAPVAALAAAAAVLLVIRSAPPAGEAALPAYVLTVAGGLDEERSGGQPEATSSIAAPPQSAVTLLLRPDTAIREALTVRVFASRDGNVHEVAADVRTSGTGSVEVRGRLGEFVGDAPGGATLVVIVARQGALFDAGALAAAGATLPAGVLVERVEARVLP